MQFFKNLQKKTAAGSARGVTVLGREVLGLVNGGALPTGGSGAGSASVGSTGNTLKTAASLSLKKA